MSDDTDLEKTARQRLVALRAGEERLLDESEVFCPRCGIRPRALIASEDAEGTEHRRLAKWCHECLATPGARRAREE